MISGNRKFDVIALLPERNDFWVSFFCKSLYGFLVLKILFNWTMVGTINEYLKFSFHSWKSYLFYAPLALTHIHYSVYLVCFICILIVSLFFRINYISAFLIYWFSISLTRLSFPLLNGSDLILNVFLLIALLIPIWPASSQSDKRAIQHYISVTGILLARVELALIYFLSGFDKLFSEMWRSGAAVYSIIHLDFYQNPLVMVNIEFSESICLLLSWGIISFELAFPIFIWFRKLRSPLLIAGILFHLGIIFFLGLVDFGLLMIITYSVFIPLQEKPSLEQAVKA